MKHVHTHFLKDYGWPLAPSPVWYQSALSWSEELRAENAKSQIYARSENFSVFLEPAIYATLQLHDIQSGAVKIEFYGALQALSQLSIISSQLAYTVSLDQIKLDSEPETDIWVDMPPRSMRKVEMQARYAGRGKPLPFDPLAED
jgi:hypothetical protein